MGLPVYALESADCRYKHVECKFAGGNFVLIVEDHPTIVMFVFSLYNVPILQFFDTCEVHESSKSRVMQERGACIILEVNFLCVFCACINCMFSIKARENTAVTVLYELAGEWSICSTAEVYGGL